MNAPGATARPRPLVLDLRSCGQSFSQPDGQVLRVLDGLDLSVAAGESVAIVGRSGSGKSTLLSILGLLRTPATGSYAVDGVSCERLDERELARLRAERFGFIFQEYMLMNRHTVRENVAVPLSTAPGHLWRRRDELVDEALRGVGLLDRSRSRPPQLSGGQKQRIAIARALVRRPSIVLADEPTGALDPGTADALVQTLIDATRQRNAALVVVTHDRDVAARMDRQFVLLDGRLVASPQSASSAVSA